MNKILLTGVIVFGMVLACLGQSKTEKTQITVMSFNVRYINTKDGVNSWANRKEKVAQVIASNKVDIAGLQEPWIDQILDLKKLLPTYDWFGWSRDDGKINGEFCPIFFNQKKYKVIEKGIFWLSLTPDKIGSKGWDVKYPRMVVWGLFKDKKLNTSFYFFNTHLGGEMARAESAKLIRSKIDEMTHGLPVILTGDLNSKPDSEAYKILVGGQNKVSLLDAFDTAKEKNDEQFTDYWFDGENKDLKRIDYIFVSPQINVRYHEIINKRIGKYYPSDHLAIKAEIEW